LNAWANGPLAIRSTMSGRALPCFRPLPARARHAGRSCLPRRAPLWHPAPEMHELGEL